MLLMLPAVDSSSPVTVALHSFEGGEGMGSAFPSDGSTVISAPTLTPSLGILGAFKDGVLNI
jgi:hypothetical protein